MNKKFWSGTVFGLVLGLSVGIATPMIAGPTDIVIKKKNPVVSEQITTNQPSQSVPDPGMQEAVKYLKEINDRMKENSDQNKEMIKAINALSNRFSPMTP